MLGIEDDRRAAKVLREGLQNDFDVEIAYDGETGIAAWKARRHRLVVLGYMLPGISGGEALQQILAIDRFQAVVILTAHASADRRHDLVFAGAADFLAKPYATEQLRRTCDSVLRHAELSVSCEELREVKGVMHRITNRVYAAERFVSEGRTWLAYNHLKSALIECHSDPPTDDELAKITAELDSLRRDKAVLISMR